MDLLLTKDGDLHIGANGDVVLSNSVRQKIRIRLLWFLAEWRWDNELGLPYFDELYIKRPNLARMKSLIRAAIFDVPEVTGVGDLSIMYDNETRVCTIRFQALTDLETIREEVSISV